MNSINGSVRSDEEPRIVKQRLHLSKTDSDALHDLCRCANDLYNYGLYNVRQYFFQTGDYLNYANKSKQTDNYRQSKTNWNYRMLRASAAQQVLRSIDTAFKSFFALNRLYTAGGLSDKPRIPGYKTKGGLSTVTLPVNHVVKKNDTFTIPMSRLFRTEHDRIKVPYPEALIGQRVKLVELVPYGNGHSYYLHYTYYRNPQPLKKLDKSKAMAIDMGVDNLCACITTDGSSFLIDGRQAKQANKKWNDQIARIQSSLTKGKTNIHVKPSTHWLDLNEWRANWMNDHMAKTARIIIDYCIDNGIGTLIIGWNTGIKNRTNMGHDNNRRFVQIPHALLISKLRYLCKEYGIRFVIQEESYTSKASFADNDNIPVYGQKGKKAFSGRRIRRGLYRTRKGYLVNADLNGAANILRKCADRLGDIRYSHCDVCHGLMANPHRIRIR